MNPLRWMDFDDDDNAAATAAVAITAADCILRNSSTYLQYTQAFKGTELWLPR